MLIIIALRPKVKGHPWLPELKARKKELENGGDGQVKCLSHSMKT